MCESLFMLGSFHTFMNMLGAKGTLLESTGLKSHLEVVYDENAVLHNDDWYISSKGIPWPLAGGQVSSPND